MTDNRSWLVRNSVGFLVAVFAGIAIIGCQDQRTVDVSAIGPIVEEIDSLAFEFVQRDSTVEMILLARELQSIREGLQSSGGARAATIDSVSLNRLREISDRLNEKLASGYIVDSELSRKLLRATNRLQDQTRRYEQRFLPPAGFLGTLPELIIALTIIGALLLFVLSDRVENRLQNIFRGADRVDLFGVEISFTSEAKEKADEVFDRFREKRDEILDHSAKARNIKQKLDNLMEGEVSNKLQELNREDGPPQVRATIHVEDILFADSLYQLVDYYGENEGRKTRGRTFTIRYGIIGRAWRFQESLSAGEMGSNQEQLILKYGLKPDEASRSSGSPKKTFIAHVIKNEGDRKLGILFIDSKAELDLPFDDVEGRSGVGEDSGDEAERHYRDSDLHALIDKKLDETNLRASLQEIVSELDERAIRMEIHER